MNAPPQIFDRQTVRQHRNRAAEFGQESSEIILSNNAQLLDRLLDVTRSFSSALHLGCRDGSLARILKDNHNVETVVAADLANTYARAAHGDGVTSLACDEEWIPFASDAFDLIIADQCLHWTNDLPGSLIQLRRCLRPDGLFLASVFGGATLSELRDCLMTAESKVRGGVTPRISPFVDVRDAGNLIQRAGLALPVADTDIFVREYEKLDDLFTDLRLMGETNAISERFKGLTTRNLFDSAEDIYRERYASSDGKLRATFEIITLTGWAPAETQQKPLAPGSARERLADTLGTEETEL